MTWLDRCHFGDVRTVLRRMIADGVKVNCIVTSPPYWGLRDYGHAGQLGLEPTIQEYIANMASVFDLCRQVLADDGTMWVNMGDSYASGDRATWRSGVSNNKGHDVQNDQTRPRTPHGLKPKDLVGQPWRLAFALQDAGWYLRQDIIWSKPNPMPESVRDRCTKAHEYLFLLAKSERYYWNFEAMQEQVSGGANPRRPGNNTHKYTAEYEATGNEQQRTKAGLVAYAQKWKTPDGWDTRTGQGGHGSFHAEGREKGHTDYEFGAKVPDHYKGSVPGRKGGPGQDRRSTGDRKLAEADSGTKNNESFDQAMAVMPATRNKRSVWTVASEPFSGAHFATFPTALIEPCILAGCPVGGVVLDPFFGSGTSGQVAQNLGRRWIGIELNQDYKALQDQRLQQPGLQLEAA